MKTDSFLSLNARGLHRTFYYEWGKLDSPVIICVHGLARNGRDFDDLAQALSVRYRVVCPDIVGRGQSDWLPPGADYGVEQYVQDMVVLIARLDVQQVDWIGTSMGGLIGMALAALPNSPVHRLVLNDIGPFVSRQALQRIGSYVGLDPRFDSVDEVERMLRQNYVAYAGLTDEQWRHLARHGCRKTDDGRFALHYDPAIGTATRAAAEADVDLWGLWRQISCPQLLLWGEQSDVLTRETVEQMQKSSSTLEVTSYPELGHAPSLMETDQIQAVLDWLG